MRNMNLFLTGVLISGIVLISGCVQEKTTPGEEFCIKSGTGEKLSLSEAKQIASTSECAKEGKLKEEHFCNEITGTWWIDLDIKKEGCSPACVIDVASKKAEINWRCTGLIPSDQGDFCGNSTGRECSSDSDCKIDGCASQVCQSKKEESSRIVCEYKSCYNADAYGLKCRCAEGGCQWTQENPESAQDSEKYCGNDEDCACGVHITTKNCFYGNRQYVDAAKQCPDYCTGIAGNLKITCVNNTCTQTQ